MAQLGLLHDDPAVSAAARAHSQYLLANYSEKISGGEPLGDAGHEELPGKTGYSSAGAAIAPNAQLAWGCGPYDTGGQIDQWIAGPFHRLAILDPLLVEAGFGESSNDGCWVAALRLAAPDEHPAPYARAIEFRLTVCRSRSTGPALNFRVRLRAALDMKCRLVCQSRFNSGGCTMRS